ncbi:MAG: efflux RND transporter permease subunit [Bacteroidaceae bacterium]|nr:efflux RND transporter permease subunit [Bacteroidaceae bacterium]
MFRGLVNRPVLVSMVVTAVSVLGVMALKRLPVSLVPEIDVPEAVVRISSPERSARDVYETLVNPLMQYLSQTPELTDIICTAEDGRGSISMKFGYDADMGYVMMDIGERIDRAMYMWPRDEERPSVSRLSASDIPAFYIDVRLMTDSDEGSFAGMSSYVRNVVHRRLEQLPQVAMVDASGYLLPELRIVPDRNMLESAGITGEMLSMAILTADITLGGFTVRDGACEYNVRYDASVKDREDVENVWLNVNGSGFRIKDLAQVREESRKVEGMVSSDGRRAVTLAVIKRADARMSDLKRAVSEVLRDIEADRPEMEFKVTRDQTGLLDYSMDNMTRNLVYGALFALAVIFLFMNNLFSALLVAFSIPLSLMLSFLSFRCLGISLNILSLSGLVMGMGMMVDNSIVVLDSIAGHVRRGEQVSDACVSGTREVAAPMFSSVLTTCAMFLPLSLMSGTGGALFHDEAVAVAVTLFSSLAVSLFVIPVYCRAVYEANPADALMRENAGSRAFGRVRDGYERILGRMLEGCRMTWVVPLVGIAVGMAMFTMMDKEKLPPITRQDILLKVGWNEYLSAGENRERCEELAASVGELLCEYTCLSGVQQFRLPQLGENQLNGATLYLKSVSADAEEAMEQRVSDYIGSRWPSAVYSFHTSGNVFDMLFPDEEPAITVRLRKSDGSAPEPGELDALVSGIGESVPWAAVQPVEWNRYVELTSDPELMTLYNITMGAIASKIGGESGNTVKTVSRGGTLLPVVMDGGTDYAGIWREGFRMPAGDVSVPAGLLLKENRKQDLKVILSDSEGEYYPVSLDVPGGRVPETVAAVERTVGESGVFRAGFSGSFFSSRELMRELCRILAVSVLLLYLILAAQFESLLQPVIVLSELVVDIAAAFTVMWCCGISVNIMSMTGIIVMCGIVINDSILKVDTINRLRKAGGELTGSVVAAGEMRFKTIVMTSLTTVLAMAPFLVRGDMGSDLQYPLSVAVIAGLATGTVASVFLIPIEYHRIGSR